MSPRTMQAIPATTADAAGRYVSTVDAGREPDANEAAHRPHEPLHASWRKSSVTGIPRVHWDRDAK